jgi:hypothetical protein
MKKNFWFIHIEKIIDLTIISIHMKKVDIVVAYYDEDLKWVDNLNHNQLGNVFIYNKSGDDRYIPLPNIGQDPHTYLTHIVKNYDNLGDAIIFLQGNPFTNGDNTILPKSINDIYNFINQLQNSDYTLNYKYENYDLGLNNGKINYWGGPLGDSGFNFYDWIKESFNIENTHGFIYFGQQFGVSREIIHKKPKKYYEELLGLFKHSKDEFCHFIERMWFNIFGIMDNNIPFEIVEINQSKITYKVHVNGKIKVQVFEKDKLLFSNSFEVKKDIIYWTSWNSDWFDKKVEINLNEHVENFVVRGNNTNYSNNYFGDFLVKKTIQQRTFLCDLMDKYGSDKASKPIWSNKLPGHNYSKLYFELFNSIRDKHLNIFELGLGTNNPEISSSMGSEGFPSASIMAWEDFFPNSKIYGADIDVDILKDTERTKTFYCDQTKPKIINQMWNHVDLLKPFDIIIEDGLHEFHANITFLENSIHKIRKGGYFIIEDIMIDTLPKWKEYFESKSDKYVNFNFKFVKLECEHNYWDNNLIVIYRND